MLAVLHKFVLLTFDDESLKNLKFIKILQCLAQLDADATLCFWSYKRQWKKVVVFVSNFRSSCAVVVRRTTDYLSQKQLVLHGSSSSIEERIRQGYMLSYIEKMLPGNQCGQREEDESSNFQIKLKKPLKCWSEEKIQLFLLKENILRTHSGQIKCEEFNLTP